MKIVYYHLATSSLYFRDAEIIQIGARGNSSSNPFEVYIFPNGEITQGAFNRHGIDDEYLAGRSAESKTEGLMEFLRYLEDLTDSYDEEIVLVNHGNYGFGMKVFGENLLRADISIYDEINELPLYQCLKFFDSQKMMSKVKEHLKYNETNSGSVVYPLRSLSLDSCAKYFLNKTRYDQNGFTDALDDANLTRRFCEKGAKTLGYGSFKKFLEENYDENCSQTFRRLA